MSTQQPTYHSTHNDIPFDNDAEPTQSQSTDTVSPFIRKTFQMVTDDVTNDTCQWDEHGTSFIVRNEQLFSSTVLPKYFRHKNFSSFVRQLNFYGFHKRSINQKYNYVKFNHPYFQRGRPDLLIHIKRKPTEQTTNFKLSLDLLEQKYDTLQKSYDDLQFTLKNMLFIFARYMSKHQASHNITPHELQQKLTDLQGRVSVHNQMPTIDSTVLHKRPRLMLDAGQNERNSTALTQQYNTIDDTELYQQILSLTERMSNMPNGTSNAASYRQYGNNDEYNNDDNIDYDDNNIFGGDEYTDTTPRTTQQRNLPIPSNIELIEDDELSPKTQFKAQKQRNTRKTNNSKRANTKSPPIKLESDAATNSTTSTPVTPNPDFSEFRASDDVPFTFDSPYNATADNNNTAQFGTYSPNQGQYSPNTNIFDNSAGMSPLHPMLDPFPDTQPTSNVRSDSQTMFDEYNLPSTIASPLATPLHISQQTNGRK